MYSIAYQDPLEPLRVADTPSDPAWQPVFKVCAGDPVDRAIAWSREIGGIHVPLVCPAYKLYAGGSFATGASGYEERLCRRSTLSATLATSAPGAGPNYPITEQAVLLSEEVVVYRGAQPDDDHWAMKDFRMLPIASITPLKRPKLSPSRTDYSFTAERDLLRDKLRGALRVCVSHGYPNVAVGDFGLGAGHLNPPELLAELWRDIVLWDPILKGRVREMTFVFEKPDQCTQGLILDQIVDRKESMPAPKPDMEIFAAVLDPAAVASAASEKGPRYGPYTDTT